MCTKKAHCYSWVPLNCTQWEIRWYYTKGSDFESGKRLQNKIIVAFKKGS